jgi:hypothetical protein
MAFTLNINESQRIIEIEYKGEVTDEEILEVEKRLRTTPEFSARYSLLHDCLSVAAFRVTGQGLYALSLRTQDITTPAAIAVSAGFALGMALTYEAMTSSHSRRVQVFTARSEALEWLSEVGYTSAPE